MVRSAAVCLLAILSCLVLVQARYPLAFRLDDVQCQFLEMEQKAIIDAFSRNQVPLTIGVITGGPAQPTGCYMNFLAERVPNNDSLVEIASHSHTHPQLDVATVNLTLEVAESRQRLQAQFPLKSISLFIPPFNAWGIPVAMAARDAGYTAMSVLCTYANILPFGVPTTVDYCTTNVYQDVQYPFFQPINGLTYVPIGTSTAGFRDATKLVNSSVLFDAPTAWCPVQSYGFCSIKSQIEANGARMKDGRTPFANVMIHPQEFNNAAMTDVQIGAYWDDVLQRAKTDYDLYTVSGLIGAMSSGASSSSSSSSSSTGGTGGGATAGNFSSSSGSARSSSTGRVVSAAAPSAGASLAIAVAAVVATAAAMLQ